MGDTVSSVFGSGGSGSSDSSQVSNNSYKNDPVNTTSPWGSVTYQSGKDDAGKKVWNQDTSLAPIEQYKLDAQNQAQIALINAVMGGKGLDTVKGTGQYNGKLTYDWTFKNASNNLSKAINQALKPLDTSRQWSLTDKGLASKMGFDVSNATQNLPYEYESSPLTNNNISLKSYNTSPLSSGTSSTMNWVTNALSNDYASKYITDPGFKSSYTYNVDINPNNWTSHVNIDPNKYTSNVYVDPNAYTSNVNVDAKKYTTNVDVDPEKYVSDVAVDPDKYKTGVDVDENKFQDDVNFNTDKYVTNVDYDRGYAKNYNVNSDYKGNFDVDDSYTKNITEQLGDAEYSRDYLSKLDDYNYSKNAMSGEEYQNAYDTLFKAYSQGFEEDQGRLLNNLEQKLANQGLALGNSAYNQSMSDYNTNYAKQYRNMQEQAAAQAYNYALQNANLRNDATQNRQKISYRMKY